jgi:hypothetical protein
MVVVKGAGSTRPAVRLFNAAGIETGHFLWEGGALVGWGWSDSQELVMVDAVGKVRGQGEAAAAGQQQETSKSLGDMTTDC